MITEERLTHLKQLEAESIHILREVAAEFDTPVMMYSVGKDSSVMLHLAIKAFAPSKPPFPMLHVDTKWKFKEMIKFIRGLQDIYPHDIKKAFKTLHKKLKVYENDPFESRAFLYLDVISWLESKIENKPVDKIIREK